MILENANEMLENENSTLKKEVAFLNTISNNSRRSSISTTRNPAKNDIKEKLLNRLNNKRDNFVVLDS